MASTVKVDFLVYGATGYLGSHVIKWLQIKGKKFTTSRSRLENRQDLLKDIELYQPKYVICAAGLAGRPNIDWFENNKQEAIRVNVVGQLNVVDVCFQYKVHCTVFGSGMVYSYDEKHPVGSGIGFSEEEEPNYTKLYYTELRVILEKLLKAYDNVLNLRVFFPLSDDFHPRSLLAKIIKFEKIVNIPNSFTVVDDLWPVMIEMIEKNITGTYNFTNPGTMTLDEMLQLYKTYIDPTHNWKTVSLEEYKTLMKMERPNAELNVDKLLTLFPNIPHIKIAVENLIKRRKQSLEQQ
jgi:nucleoside-diphosphate-sugar epimerase